MQGGKYKVSGDSGTNRDRCGLGISRLTDHDDIRILTKQCAKACLKGQSGSIIYLCLIDFPQIFLYRILDGGDVDTSFCHLLKYHIQCRGLSTSGRTGQIDDSVWAVQHRAETFVIIFFHTEGIRMLDRGVSGKKTHDRFFTEYSRKNGYTDVHILPFDIDTKMSVLWDTSLCDIQI